jgi:hypothetical protein
VSERFASAAAAAFGSFVQDFFPQMSFFLFQKFFKILIRESKQEVHSPLNLWLGVKVIKPFFSSSLTPGTREQ